MSIASEISRLQTSKADVKTQVNIDKDLINGGIAFINDETVDDYDDKIEEMQEAYKKFIPLQTASGTEITIDNSNDDKVITDIALYGNTEQFTTTGKNLYNGVSKNRYVASNGTIADMNENYLGLEDKVAVLPNTTYTITFYGQTMSNLTWAQFTSDGTFIDRNTTGLSTFTTGSTTYYVYVHCFDANGIYTTVNTKVQLELGSSSTTFEPYTGRNSFTKSIISSRS